MEQSRIKKEVMILLKSFQEIQRGGKKLSKMMAFKVASDIGNNVYSHNINDESRTIMIKEIL